MPQPQYAVNHGARCKANTYALGKHISRENMPENADPTRSHLNQYLVEHGNNIMRTIDKRIEEGYTGETAIRKDAVKAINVVLSGTHERMIEIEKTGHLGEWVQVNQDWLNTRYGKENVISLALHMDELTPHLHAVIVPLTPDGRLSAKDVIGDKSKMRQMQTDYAKAMEPFGLERGKEGSRAHHEDVKEYYTRMKIDLPRVTEEIEEKKEEVKELKQEIPRLHVVINKQEEELEKLKKAESKLKIKLAEIRAKLAGFTMLKGFKYISEGIHALWTRKAKFEALNRENSTLNQKYDETYNELVKVAQASKMVISDLQQENTKLTNKNQQLGRENKELKQEVSNIKQTVIKSINTVVEAIRNDMINRNVSYVYFMKDNKLDYMGKDEYLKAKAEEKKKELHIPTVDEIRGIDRKKNQGRSM
jgi:predicted  nucleic acid-binding Zn-ribbon protein